MSLPDVDHGTFEIMTHPDGPTSTLASTPLETERRWSTLLASVGGFVDAAGFLLIFGLFTAHMSGNSTGLCVALATGEWAEAIRRGFVIPVFVLATVAGVAWIEAASDHPGVNAARSRAMASVLAAEVAMLLLFLFITASMRQPISLDTHPSEFFLAATSATLAMGFQNAALRRVKTLAVHTTFVTGMLTSFAVGLVQWRLRARAARSDATVRDQVTRARSQAALSFLIWLSYVIGAFAGAWLVARLGVWVVALPIAALILMIGVLARASGRPPTLASVSVS